MSLPPASSSLKSQWSLEEVQVQQDVSKYLILQRNLECQYGLLVQLQSRDILSEDDIDSIQSINSARKQNEELIRLFRPMLRDAKKLEQIHLAFKNTNQMHLVQYLSNDVLPGSSGADQEEVDNRPLTDVELRKIRSALPELVDNIFLEDGLMNKLYADGVLTNMHRCAIIAAGDFYKKNEKFLDILMHRSFAQYQQFLKCLKDCHQEHIIEIINGDRDGNRGPPGFIIAFSETDKVILQPVGNLHETTMSYGVAQLGKYIYALRFGSEIIRIYNSTTLAKLKQVVKLPARSPWRPLDIGYSLADECLYVADRHDQNNCCTWCISNKDQSVHLWNETGVRDPHCRLDCSKLSVTSDGRILRLVYNPPRLMIFNSRAELLEELILPYDMPTFSHAVETSNGHFLICCGWEQNDADRCPQMHKIYEVERDVATGQGHVIRSYGTVPGKGEGQLNGPVHLALDHADHVYVADYNNNRVLALDSTLSTCRVVKTWDADSPLRLSYYKPDERFYIAMKEGPIEAYKLRILGEVG